MILWPATQKSEGSGRIWSETGKNGRFHESVGARCRAGPQDGATVDLAVAGGMLGEVRAPQFVGPGSGEMAAHLARRQSLCRDRQYDLIDTCQTEAAVGIAGASIWTGPISVNTFLVR